MDISSSEVAIDVGGIAYSLLVSRPEEWKLGDFTTIFVEEIYGENDHYLVGFSSKLEKEAFKSLVGVKGIGPKTAISALSATTPDELFKAISLSNTAYLKKLPGIGPKAASQIILDLKGKLAISDDKKANKSLPKYEEAKEALKTLGFKSKDIDNALSQINDDSLDTQGVLRLALKSLKKGNSR